MGLQALILIGFQLLFLFPVASHSSRLTEEDSKYRGPCHFSCNRCSGPSAKSCIDCAANYIFVDYKKGSKCYDSCPKGFHYNKESRTCETCSLECTFGCKDTPNDCNKCSDPTYYDPISDACVSDCAYPGWYAVKDQRICKQCPDKNCLTCGKAGECKKCKGFWNLDVTVGRCTHECPNGCSHCQASNPSVCLRCVSGWELHGQICSRAHPIPFCEAYVGEITCDRCKEGFYNNKTNCVRCSDSCSVCNANAQCQVCDEGFYSANGVCKSCNEGCKFCNQNSCLLCENDYVLENGVCREINSTGSQLLYSKIISIAIVSVVSIIALLGFVLCILENCVPDAETQPPPEEAIPPAVILVEIQATARTSDENKVDKPPKKIKIIETLKSKALVAQGLGVQALLKLDLAANRLLQRRRKKNGNYENQLDDNLSKLDQSNKPMPESTPMSLINLNVQEPLENIDKSPHPIDEQSPHHFPLSLAELNHKDASPTLAPVVESLDELIPKKESTP